jgi:hypothetical protein
LEKVPQVEYGIHASKFFEAKHVEVEKYAILRIKCVKESYGSKVFNVLDSRGSDPMVYAIF